MPEVKKHAVLPVHIVEEHNDALHYMLRCVATKHLPFNNNLLIHLDSHPDLLIPANLKKDEVFDKDVLNDKISIENWIMPAAFAGHFDTIVWCKPPWANQIPDGHYNFDIGIEKSSGFVRVSSGLLYYVSEMLYCNTSDMIETKNIDLYVRTIYDYSIETENKITLNEETHNKVIANDDSKKTTISNQSDLSTKELQLIDLLVQLIEKHNGIFVLDVDLDFFSTHNPFIELFSCVNGYEILKRIYQFSLDFSNNQTIANNQLRRKTQILPLEKLFVKLQDMNDRQKILENIDSIVEIIDDIDRRSLVKELVLSMVKHSGPDLDWLLVHDAGCTWDSSEHCVPHHESTATEIKNLFAMVTKIFESICDPVIVTIARSSLDDYCPPSQVEFIQEMFCSYLRKKYECKISFNYDTEETSG